MDNHTSSPVSTEEASSVTAGSDQSASGSADTAVAPTGAFTEYDGACVLHLAGVRNMAVEWLWPGVIPLRKLTVLDGDPGLGKSTLIAEIAARVTTGRSLPFSDEVAEPGGVLLCCAEDSPADTIRPRLEAAGASMDRVHMLTEVVGHLPRFPDDLKVIYEIMMTYGIRLLNFDPLAAFFSPALNLNRDQDVRSALGPLAHTVELAGCAAVLTRHLNKRSDTTAIQAGGGSIGIIGAARTGLLLVRDPEDKDSRILVGTKSNLARLPRAMRLRLVEHPALKVPRIEWLEQVDRDPDQLLDALRRPKGRSKLDDAVVLIAELLSKGPLPSVEVAERTREAGFSERTTERARKKLGVRSERPSGGPPDAGWQCRLPSEEAGQQDLAAFAPSALPDEG